VDDQAAIVFARPSLVNGQSQSNWEHHDSRTCFLYAQSKGMCAETAQPSQFQASQLHPPRKTERSLDPEPGVLDHELDHGHENGPKTRPIG
jgi:hypothetical protein